MKRITWLLVGLMAVIWVSANGCSGYPYYTNCCNSGYPYYTPQPCNTSVDYSTEQGVIKTFQPSSDSIINKVKK